MGPGGMSISFDRARRHRLAAARLAHAHCLAAVGRRSTLSTARTMPSSVLNQVFRPHVEKRIGHCPLDHAPRITPRSQSPMKLMDSTVRKMAAPGIRPVRRDVEIVLASNSTRPRSDKRRKPAQERQVDRR